MKLFFKKGKNMQSIEELNKVNYLSGSKYLLLLVLYFSFCLLHMVITTLEIQ